VLFNNPPAVAGDPFVCEPRNAKGERVVVPVLHIHGTQDSLVPYTGGVPRPTIADKIFGAVDLIKALVKQITPGKVDMEFPSVEASRDHWLRLNSEVEPYTGPVKDESITADRVKCESYTFTGGKTFTLCTLDDGHGHQWPKTPLQFPVKTILGTYNIPACPSDEYIQSLTWDKAGMMIYKKQMTDIGIGCSTTFDATGYIWKFFEKHHL